ncbi:MAG: BamA/OMP85 family outer membrane protein [Candidatus Karelsulcia muelleri]
MIKIKLFKNLKLIIKLITIIFCVLFFNTKIYCKDNNDKDFNIKDIELIELIEKVYEKPSKEQDQDQDQDQGNKEISFENTETEANVNREKDNKTDFQNISEKKIGETYFNKIYGEEAKKTYKNKTYPKKENKTPRPRPRSRPDVEADAEAEVKAYKPKIDFNKFYKRINKKMIDDIYYSDKDQKENKTKIEFDKKIIDKIEKKYNIDSIYNHENGMKISGIEIDKNGIKIEKNDENGINLDKIDENGRDIDRIEIEKAEEEEKVVIEKQVVKDKKIELLPLIDYKIGDKLNIKNNKFNEIKRKLLNTGHFSNVSIKIKSLNNKDIILQIFFTIKDRFDIIKILGIKEKDINHIYNIIGLNLSHNTRLNDDFKKKIVKLIQGYYENNGYLDVTFNFEQMKDSSKKNLLLITVNKGRIMKLTKFLFEGNYSFTEKKLKKVLNLNKINYKYYEIIKNKIIDFYLTNGFKDVEITSFSLEKENNNNYLLKIKINEGKKYILGNISYQGNNSFNDEDLSKLIGLKKGDVYNTLLLNKNILDNTNPNSIISLYLNNGYAFSTIYFSEEKKENNSIDIKLIISEGDKVILNKVNIIGNNKIKDKIILRELTTMPGDFFSKKEIEKTLKNLKKLDLFEKIFLNIQKNEKYKLIDLNFIVLEKTTSKLQFKIDTNFIGIISLNVNNFSLLNSFNPKNWNPIPYGDNQKIIFNLEIGKKIICYNISFIDPLIFDFSSLKLNFSSSKEKKNDDLLSSYLEIEKLLNENNKILFNINYQNRKKNFLESKKQIYKDLNYSISINHNSVSPNNFFPKKGQILNFKTQFTLPYSLINTTYKNKLLEYFKVQFEYFYYKELLNRLTTKIGYEFGILHSNNKKSKEFNNFYMGGTNFKPLIEKSFIPLRGYYEPNNYYGIISPKNGGLIYEKFITELNYLIFDQGFAKCWLTNFFEAGNIYDKYKDFSFFNLKRSLGTGIKLYINNIGFLGCDIAYRCDKTIDNLNPGWKMDFFFKKEF